MQQETATVGSSSIAAEQLKLATVLTELVAAVLPSVVHGFVPKAVLYTAVIVLIHLQGGFTLWYLCFG